jgi:NADH-quinone oxidoreductase subunit G
MKNENTIWIDNHKVPVQEGKNLLEHIRETGIEIPTFCYHSELSIYGACRMCMVDIEGRGIQASCSIMPEAGMKVKTNTEEIREIRKINLELLLANHDQSCPTCVRSDDCKLRELASRVGISTVRFPAKRKERELDHSNPSLVRDPNKCVLCGDCVRFCSEIQGVGAIDFAHRGADAMVSPAYECGLDKTECVYCGQCANVCPTGAIVPKSDIESVWKDIFNKEKTVIAQIAPATRVALGEAFGFDSGDNVNGRMVAALRTIGFDKVYDTSYAADLTVIEEANEFLNRKQKNEKLPIFTSCCPAWVKNAEQYHPELLEKLSSCRSPQQMFGSLLKDEEVKAGANRKDTVVVSVMPCTAKKYECQRDEFKVDGIPDVDYVLTTTELIRMIKEAGIQFKDLEPEALDMPFGLYSGAGVLFGKTGGVSEAVLRYAAGLKGKDTPVEIETLQDNVNGLTVIQATVGDLELKVGVVYGLKAANDLANEVKAGKVDLDIIEVMACPDGCIGGAGQPVSHTEIRKKRAKGLRNCDKRQQLRNSGDNPYIKSAYDNNLGEVGGHKAHELLHTHYHNRRRIRENEIHLIQHESSDGNVTVKVCMGTSCFVKQSQKLLGDLLEQIKKQSLEEKVEVKATFCMENCGHGPSVSINGESCSGKTVDEIMTVIKSSL